MLRLQVATQLSRRRRRRRPRRSAEREAIAVDGGCEVFPGVGRAIGQAACYGGRVS